MVFGLPDRPLAHYKVADCAPPFEYQKEVDILELRQTRTCRPGSGSQLGAFGDYVVHHVLLDLLKLLY